ncbi:MAG: antitoxin component YwqK of YwqJK toxin-antitoxin module [Cyclobacteriaceae bacterium]
MSGVLCGQTFLHKTYYDLDQNRIKAIISSQKTDSSLLGPYNSFHLNGKVAVTGFYKDNKADSLWTYYYESGSKRAQGSILDGQQIGKWAYYYENGRLKNEGYLSGTMKMGPWISYYENGQLKGEGFYNKNGQLDSIWTAYYEDQLLKSVTDYSSNKGSSIEYFPSGEIRAIGSKRNRINVGVWKYYDRTGNLESEGQYKDGRREGDWIEYHTVGSVRTSGNYKKGVKNGKWFTYHTNGETESVGHIDEGMPNGTWNMYFPTGEVMGSADYTFGSGPISTYYQSGEVASEGQMKDGLKDSTWNYYYPSGSLKGVCQFSDNVGTYRGFYENGNIKIEGALVGDKKSGEWKMFDSDGLFTGSYVAVYDKNKLFSPTVVEDQSTPILEEDKIARNAQVPDYRYKRRQNRYFDEVINEFHGLIVSVGSPMIIANFLPFSFEYYLQERLGHEIVYSFAKAPFFQSLDALGFNEINTVGHSVSFRQKFYGKEKPFGLLYFGHQVQAMILNSSVKTQEVGGFRRTFTSDSKTEQGSYGLFVGWRWLLDAGERGLSVDTHVGYGISISRFQAKSIEDPDALPILQTRPNEPIEYPLSFGLSIGWIFDLK